MDSRWQAFDDGEDPMDDDSMDEDDPMDEVPLLERFKVRRVTCLVICLVTLAAGLASHPHSRT